VSFSVPRQNHRLERERRIEITARLLADGYRDGQIKRMVAAECGCRPLTVRGYIAEARRRLRAALGKGRDEHRAEALAWYQQMKRAASNDYHRIRAAQRIDELLGLEEPRPRQQQGESLSPEEFAERLEAFREAERRTLQGNLAELASDPEAYCLAREAARRVLAKKKRERKPGPEDENGSDGAGKPVSGGGQ